MLSTFEKGILELIGCALNGGEPQLGEGFDFEQAYSFAQERQITPIIYYGAVNVPDFMSTLAGKKFFKSTMNMSFYCAEQDEVINGLRKAFKDNGIEHMLVKGTVIRSLYPYPEMRLMSDADILIRTTTLMQQLTTRSELCSMHSRVGQNLIQPTELTLRQTSSEKLKTFSLRATLTPLVWEQAQALKKELLFAENITLSSGWDLKSSIPINRPLITT